MEREGRVHQNASCALGACTTETNCHHHHHPPLTTAHLDSDRERTGKEKTVDPHGEPSDGTQARGLQEPEAPASCRRCQGSLPRKGNSGKNLKEVEESARWGSGGVMGSWEVQGWREV